MKQTIIPDQSLAIMGGRTLGDPPVVWHQHQSMMLPASGACLKRVLARWLGKKLEPEDVPWLRWNGLGWVLRLPRQRIITFAPEPHHFGPCIPGLTAEMTRTEALAEIFVWLARLQRLANETGDDGPVSSFEMTSRPGVTKAGRGWSLGIKPIDGANHLTDPMAALAHLEELHGLAEWRVT